MDWKAYIRDFEKRVIECGIAQGVLGKPHIIPVQMGKLAGTRFGSFVGLCIDSNMIFAVDYYGHIKKTDGFYRMVRELSRGKGKMIKLYKTTTVHFASLKIEDILNITGDSLLTAGFVKLKQELLALRGFR